MMEKMPWLSPSSPGLFPPAANFMVSPLKSTCFQWLIWKWWVSASKSCAKQEGKNKCYIVSTFKYIYIVSISSEDCFLVTAGLKVFSFIFPLQQSSGEVSIENLSSSPCFPFCILPWPCKYLCNAQQSVQVCYAPGQVETMCEFR